MIVMFQYKTEKTVVFQFMVSMALSQKVGVSRQAINTVERGKYVPSLQLAFDIAQQFDLPIEEVCCLVDKSIVNQPN
jgi:putative transcriptional regulator